MPTLRRSLDWAAHEFGLVALWQTGPDAWVIIVQRSLRMFGFGVVNLILALFFHELHISDDQIGFFFSCTLWGDVLLSLALTAIADGLGRRNILILGSLLMSAAGAAFALSENYFVLLIAAVVGVISVSGSEIGPFRAIEESTLAHLTTPETRTYVLMWYIVIATIGTALGLGLCGRLVDYLQESRKWTALEAYHSVFWIYALVGAINLSLSFVLSKECELKREPEPKPEPPKHQEPNDEADAGDPDSESQPFLSEQNGEHPSTPASASSSFEMTSSRKSKEVARRSLFMGISSSTLSILLRLCALMFIDSFASGMVPFSLINYYVDGKFHLPKGKLGSIMSSAWLCSAAGNLAAGSVAARIGLIRTMVFTHLPSALFLALLPAPRGLALTVVLLVARACLSSMDQAPRAAFVSAIVRPEERTKVMGVVNVMKTLAQSAGPWSTGALAGSGRFWIAFVVAGSLKAVYDVLLLVMFVNARLHQHEKQGKKPSERTRPQSPQREEEADDDRGAK